VHSRLLAIPHYFVLGNLASMIAFYQFLRGERYARWDPIRADTASYESKDWKAVVNSGKA
jgi:hypothetical protein